MEEKRYGYIYEITFPDGKVYVGKHIPKHKGEAYNWYMGSGNYVKNFLKEHSKDELTKKLLVEGEFTIDELNKLEVEYVSKYKQLPNCVNKARGGDGGDTSKFIDYNSEEYKKNHSDGIKRQRIEKYGSIENYSQITKEKNLSLLRLNPDCFSSRGFLGKHHTKETKQKLSEIAKESNKLHSRESREKGFKKQIETCKRKKEQIAFERIKLLEDNNYKELDKEQIRVLLGFETIRSVNRFLKENNL